MIISTDRGKRPMDFLRESVIPKDPKNCPFCPGNETKTPNEVLVYGRNGGSPNSAGWSIRDVGNAFRTCTRRCVVVVSRPYAGSEERQALPIRADFQESWRSGGRDGGAYALAINRTADCAAQSARRSGQLLA